VGLRPLGCWDCGFESRLRHGCLSVVIVVCCQVEVSATGWSLVQRSPTECGVSVCVRDASIMRRPWPTRAVEPLEKHTYIYIYIHMTVQTQLDVTSVMLIIWANDLQS
jgi:hypothetical protein